MKLQIKRLTALYRQASYSPNQHRTNDTAILDATVAHLEARGWRATRWGESDIVDGAAIGWDDADLVVSMCQGPQASEVLLDRETAGGMIVNRPSSVLSCHRHRLVSLLEDGRIAFPRTAIVPTSGDAELDGFGTNGRRVWLKRGDVHAERREDVVNLLRDEIPAALHAFADRGIARVALQEHVPGPVLKFYGVADESFFRFYEADAGPQGPVPPVNEACLRELAFTAAARVGLDVFGGDVALPEPDRPVLIDLNDWPSFAPYREDAARHIAEYLHQMSSSTLESPA
jgi:hypothetical protein